MPLHREPGPLHVALTGNIASGKSTVASMLREKGATIIDADVLAREAVAPGTPGFEAVVSRFGDAMVSADGSLDRARLRERVFGDDDSRRALEEIVHPIVGRLREQRLEAADREGDRVVISDIPLLYETGLDRQFAHVILVDAPADSRLTRLVDTRGLDAAAARAMIAAQMPASEKRSRATWVIDNDGSMAQLALQVDALWSELVGLAATRATGPSRA